MSTPKAGLSAAGAVVAASLASACCIGPAVLAFVGLGGAASALVLAPYRPFLMTLAFVLLGCGFYLARRRTRDCCADGRTAASTGRGMKSILWIATLFVALLAGSSQFIGGAVRPLASRGDGAAAKVLPGGEIAARTTTLDIRGMTCGGCVARVEERLDEIRGVVGYEVSLEKNEARVSYDPAATTPEVIVAAVAETGFAASINSRSARE